MEYGRRKKRIPKDQKFKDAVCVYDWNPTWDPKKIEFGRKKHVTIRPPKLPNGSVAQLATAADF